MWCPFCGHVVEMVEVGEEGGLVVPDHSGEATEGLCDGSGAVIQPNLPPVAESGTPEPEEGDDGTHSGGGEPETEVLD